MSWNHPALVLVYVLAGLVVGLLVNQWAAWRSYLEGYFAGRQDERDKQQSET